MAIKKIKLPNNTTEDINDPRLPAVTATDNGKVLSVIGGLWAKRVSSDFVHTSGNETIAGTKTFTSDVEINDIISTENGDDYPEGFDWIQDYNGSSLQDALDTKSEFSGNYNDLTNKPSSLPASDVYAWAKASSKPSYTLDEVPDGSTRALSNFLPRNGGYTMTANAAISWGNNDRTDWNTYVSGIRPMSSTSSSSGAPIQYCSGINIKSRYGVQLAHAATSNRFWGRVENKSWVEFYHSDNANKSDVNWACNNLTAAGTVTQGSDSRIKDNQQEILSNDAIAVIERLVPKTWTWNEKTVNAGKKAAGLVAQEVEEVIPVAVTISKNGDIKDFHSLNYNTIQGYEIAAIKGLIEEVKSLKAEVAELKKQIK